MRRQAYHRLSMIFLPAASLDQSHPFKHSHIPTNRGTVKFRRSSKLGKAHGLQPLDSPEKRILSNIDT